jgi:hypothetical protein
MDPLKMFFAPIQPFVWHPERIAIVACILLLAYLMLRRVGRFRPRPILVSAVIWGAFALWEWYCKIQGYNIRIDLFLIYPVLIIVTVWSLIAGLRKRRPS